MPERDISRLLTAMIINRKFARDVLDPASREATIKRGYLEEAFDLTTEELARLLQINTDSLQDFANHLVEPIEPNS